MDVTPTGGMDDTESDDFAGLPRETLDAMDETENAASDPSHEAYRTAENVFSALGMEPRGFTAMDTTLMTETASDTPEQTLSNRSEENNLSRAAERLGKPSDRISLEEVMGTEAYEHLVATDPNAVPDEVLFE